MDNDVASLLEAYQREYGLSFAEAVDRALRCGLQELHRSFPGPPARTRVLDLGPCLLPNLDNIGEVLDMLEDGGRFPR
ncbi:MAG: hypothetical protein MUC42_02065 [Bryobacter sp.]|nr:hypothetical protein [Bryobacter sp.]